LSWPLEKEEKVEIGEAIQNPAAERIRVLEIAERVRI
jgi:hypothetical protein